MIITRILILSGMLTFGIGVIGPLPRAAETFASQTTASPPTSQTTASPTGRATSRVKVTVPQDDTELVVDGKTVQGSGPSRVFETPSFARGTSQRYTFTATWRPNTYTTMTRSKTVSVRAGDAVDGGSHGRRSERPRTRDLRADTIRCGRRDGQTGRRHPRRRRVRARLRRRAHHDRGDTRRCATRRSASTSIPNGPRSPGRM